MTGKSILFIQRSHPGELRAKEALDAALVAAIFEQNVTLLFRDAGVLQLCASRSDPSTRELCELVESLADYGIHAVYACRHSLAEEGIGKDDLSISVTPLDFADQAKLLAEQQAVVND